MASETIADIVAEMRKRKEMLEVAIYSAPVCYSTDSQKAQVEIIDEFLDRIEAAAKRERAFHAMTEEANERLREHLAIALKGGVGNAAAMREALTKLVAHLEKEVRRTAKCKRCEYNGKSFRGEPCYWHIDCGIDQSDDEASDNAMRLLRKFKLREALSAPARNCGVPHKDGHELWVRWQAYCTEIYPRMVSFSMWLLAPTQEGGAE